MKRLLLLTMALIVLALPVRAEPGPIGNWLMNEPVTLFDWGMMRAENAADRAAEFAQEWRIDENWAVDETWVPDRIQWDGRVSYSWDNNEIEILVSLLGSGVSREEPHRSCNHARRMFLAILSGYYDMTNEESVRDALHAAINRWFSHSGFARLSRDEQLAEKLARIIFVSVRMWAPTGDGAFSAIHECGARIMEFNAPSKPLDSQR